jgi:DNA-binding MarR family transcriptional regulator/GNAT superfamily N-acetyltransferase
MQDQSLAAIAGQLRRFNRFYTREIGVLDRHLFGSGYSLSEARVLYELAHGDKLTASDFVWRLGIDGGYLSRMLNAFEKDGLLVKRASETDRRVSYLALTEKGRAAYAGLDHVSQAAAEARLRPLGEARRQRLVAAMHEIETLFENGEDTRITLRPHRVGDMGWIVHRQARLYADEYGWDIGYEALIAEIAGRFVREFDAAREHCWIAERAGEVVGSVFLVRGDEEGVAKLRLLYVEASARGLGVGRRLVGECIASTRAKGYKRLDLWTQSILADACRLYAAAGFRLIREEPHHSFGHDLVGQFWSLDL